MGTGREGITAVYLTEDLTAGQHERPTSTTSQVAASSASDQNPRSSDPHRERRKRSARQTPMRTIAVVPPPIDSLHTHLWSLR